MIAVVDYGMGNLRSVGKALEAAGAEVQVTGDAKDIDEASAIVLPGVGAFHRAMENLEKLDIVPSILKSIKGGKPFLGICLGLQLLFTESEEHGIHKGLDIIKGSVKGFGPGLKVPHMGWNQVKFKIQKSKIKFNVLKDVPNNAFFYFVHTYYGEPKDKDVIAATTEYGKQFASAVHKDNVWGVQFHPEKSSSLGLKILENFYSYVK